MSFNNWNATFEFALFVYKTLHMSSPWWTICFLRSVHSMSKRDIANHELLIANRDRYDKYLKDLGAASHV